MNSLVAQIQGTLSLERENGTEFRIEFAFEPVKGTIMGDVKILVVEDEAVTGMDIRRSLTELGYSVCAIATTGEHGGAEGGRTAP